MAAITLLDMLINAGLITRAQFEEALRNRVLFGGKIGTSLIELGYLEEEDLARFLGKKLAVPYVHPDQILAIPPAVIELIPTDIALKYRVIPIHLDKKRLYLVMADPSDLTAIDEIAFRTGYVIRPLVTPEVRLVQALGKYYRMEIDLRYQQIIARVEERKKEGMPIRQPLPAPPAFEAAEEELEEAEIINEEELARRVKRFAPDEVSLSLARAGNREEIAAIMIDYLGREFERGALFLIREDAAYGWKGVYRRQELPEIEKISIPLTGSSALKTVVESAGFYLGPLPATPLNDRLIEGLGHERPETALLMPLVIMGRVVNILYAEGGKTELGERVTELQKLLTKASLAFEILICRDKILML
jgi:Type II secretion system (T2SS), protein E, N-terminal domain